MTDDGKRIRTQLEIDFIATMGSKKYYLQSAFSLPDETKIKLEKASLLNVNDSFKKLVIVNDMLNVRRRVLCTNLISIFPAQSQAGR
ncbi:MAG: hypothetical protein E7277_06870 [Lachnospiraceae bacterium]|jgi:hypothetical protein|nr:hypothetical protein [Lachnospiraceae bacterium]